MPSLATLAEGLDEFIIPSQPLDEAVREDELFEPEPGESAPSSTHEIKRVRMKGVKHKGKYFSKRSASDLQTLNEYLTWGIYKAAKLRVAPRMYLVLSSDGQHLRTVQGSVSGKQLKGSSTDPIAILKGTDISKGFFIDALLGNWDVIGNAPQFNIFIQDGGKVARIDTGGLDFRAQGARKKAGDFGDMVQEIATWAGIAGDRSYTMKAAQVFGSMTQEDVRKAAKLFKRLRWSKVEAVLTDAVKRLVEIYPPNSKEMKSAMGYINKMTPILKKRHAYLDDVIKHLGMG